MLSKLNLGQKFTLMLLGVFMVGILMGGIALSRLLNYTAQAELTSKALMLMETMNAVRQYTVDEVTPEISERSEVQFLPETVPSYSAHTVFKVLQSSPDYQDFSYREAVLNPTNPKDKADQLEASLVSKFKEADSPEEFHDFRNSPGGKLYYIARPIQIKQEACLSCHSTPERAPKSMVDLYGRQNGFGWKLNDIIGTQIISVPAQTVFTKARKSLLITLGVFTGVFAIAILLVNYWLKRYVVRPLNRMAATAEAVSTGDTKAEFTKWSDDEVGKLTDSFNRMRLSLQMAMQRLERNRNRRPGGSQSG
ncbi:c-type heme family protein [Leptothoe sp. PORK10 BA2]|uniref:c-type heme family protein n=1 Tax=Leptothoe sp. PORK10 BA2 TaxID=3110254 RepID=UPI002B20DD16|nr:DUF3365 domain-containing protein [Leptothoe sp. PORK10 BA2]MEA5463691.1 DUF3365 domain-containing protein [Leptothoe sp. PORK10 BA2]